MRWIYLAAVPLALQVGVEARQTAAPQPKSAEFFESLVRPVLAANCYDCHADERMGGLRVDSRDGLLKGGVSGPAIAPGDLLVSRRGSPSTSSRSLRGTR